MNINYEDILNIKTDKQLNKFLIDYNLVIDKPLINNNYIFHYFTLLGNLSGLKLNKFPIYIENTENLNCFHIAARESHIDILYYLIENYPEYIYNRNNKEETIISYLDLNNLLNLMKKYPKLDWYDLIVNYSNNTILKNILLLINYNNLIIFLKILNINLVDENMYLFYIIENNNIMSQEKIIFLNKFSDDELNTKSEISGLGLIFIIIQIRDLILFNYILNRNIDLDYYVPFISNHPLLYAIYYDITDNTNNYTIKLINKIKLTNINFYKSINKYNENIFHYLIRGRIKTNNHNIITNYIIDTEIFKYADNEALLQLNIDKITPLELLIYLDYNIYAKYIQNCDILIPSNIIKNIKKLEIDKRWIKLYIKKNLIKNYGI